MVGQGSSTAARRRAARRRARRRSRRAPARARCARSSIRPDAARLRGEDALPRSGTSSSATRPTSAIPKRAARASCTSASPPGSRTSPAIARRVRGDPRLPPRAGVPITGRSSAASTSGHGRLHSVAAAGWRPRAGERSRAATCLRPSTCSSVRQRFSKGAERRTYPMSSSTSGSRSASAATCARRRVCSARPSRPPKRAAMRRWQSEHGSNG